MKRLPVAARGPVLLALFGACGAGLWALASCGSNSLSPVDAGGDATLTDASRPLIDAARDAASDTANLDEGDGGLGCTAQPGWTVIHPFFPACTMQVAPPELWANAALLMEPCGNGQSNCTHMVIPKPPGHGLANFAVYPVEDEAEGFYMEYAGDPIFEVCRRGMYVIPGFDGYRLGGAIDSDLTQCLTKGGNGDVLFAAIKRSTRAQRVAVSKWSSLLPPPSLVPNTEFPQTHRSRSTLFTFDTVMAQVDIIDIPTNALIKSVHYPTTISQWNPIFATHDELWGSAGYGALGKSEVWRVDRTGTFTAMLQKKGVHIFAPQTDGTTLFWAEGSGNDADFYPQPKLEIWSAPFSSDPAIVAQGARRLLDVSGVGEVRFGTVHHGYYAANLGVSEILVIRASDGAFQRIPLLGGWGRIDFGYVDEQQVWFGHGALNAAQAGVSRIQLQPWP